MTNSFVPLRHIVALSIAIALCAAPLASAQTLKTDPDNAPPASPTLLNAAAFARLVRLPPVVAPPSVGKNAPRPDLHQHGTTAMARQAQSAPAKAPQQQSWTSRHKVLNGILVGLVVAAVALTVCMFACPE
jgi:hypothetical protein